MKSSRYVENVLWIVPLVALVFLAPAPRTSFSSAPADAVWDACGALLIVLGAIVRTCARGWKHEQGRELPGKQLVTTGPYAQLRHPLYFGTLLCGVGVCMIHGSPIVFAGFMLSFVLWYAVVIRREEKKLRTRWPDAHATYCREVPLLFPRPRGFGALLATWPRDVRKSIAKEADALFIWPLAGLLVRLWQVVGSRGERFEQHRTEAIAMIVAIVAALLAWLLLKQHGSHARKRTPEQAP